METKNKDLITLPILPLKSAVLFPNMLVPLVVGRPRSVAALDAAISSEEGSEQSEVESLRKRLDEAALPENIHKEFERELKQLKALPSASPDFNTIRSHLELILELPWNKSTEDSLDIGVARKILDEDHHGLEEVNSSSQLEVSRRKSSPPIVRA